jgi:hypothetical protein
MTRVTNIDCVDGIRRRALRAHHASDERTESARHVYPHHFGAAWGEGRAKSSINPMQCLKSVISSFFAHLGSMTEAGGALPWLQG